MEMELWFTEEFRNSRLGFKITGTLYRGRSQYQEILVVQTASQGRVLALDGRVMITEKDEFIYHEMIAHVPLHIHPRPERVLIIGGGDGGAVREVVRHPEVQEVHLCELDGMVIDICKEYLPFVTSGLDDPRVHIHHKDGAAFIRDCGFKFDVILVDSTDPDILDGVLFTKSFYAGVCDALKPDGLMAAQSESVFYCEDDIIDIYSNLYATFPQVSMYLATIPSYPGATWSFALAAKQTCDIEPSSPARIESMESQCQYYNAEIHRAAFALPAFLRRRMDKIRVS